MELANLLTCSQTLWRIDPNKCQMPDCIVHVQFSSKGTKGKVGSSNLLYRHGAGTEDTSICTKIIVGINAGSLYHRPLKATSEVNPMTMREGRVQRQHASAPSLYHPQLWASKRGKLKSELSQWTMKTVIRYEETTITHHVSSQEK